MKMKKYFIASGIAAASIFGLASCTKKNIVETPDYVIYCAPDADPNGKGTIDSPIDFTVALATAQPGTTIALAGGVYSYNARLNIKGEGKPNKYITVMPATTDDVIFDFSEMTFNGTNRGIQIYGDYWHFKDITVRGAGDNGMYVAGSYNIIENCVFYNNRDTGLQIGRGYSEETTINQWPSYNLIKNCVSYANYDDATYGENADGYACKLTAGFGNVFDGCIAFRNSDDGWDLFAKEDSGNIGTVVLYNCLSFENGYLPYQIDRVDDTTGTTYKSFNTRDGDGIGFKLGGSTMEGDVILNNCVSFNNKLHGFGDNSNPGVINIKNSTAFNNCIELTEDGKVGGRDTNGGKSNNIDLARGNSGISNSYNNYEGILSYINNQSNFNGASDSAEDSDDSLTYNADKFRGSASYSIFQTGYSKGEKYTTFTAPEDASIYSTSYNDITFSKGTAYTGMNDNCFADLSPINALCNGVDDLSSLMTIIEQYRNPDHSINLGDKLKVVDQTLLTYNNGSQIGANLSKSSYEEYPHYAIPELADCTNAAEVRVNSVYSVLEILGSPESIYQDFEVSALIDDCDISWQSSNTDVLYIDDVEKTSVSNAIYKKIKINVPDKDTEVKLTATIKYGDATKTKEFDLIVKSRGQSMGAVVNSGDNSIKVDKFGTYVAPRIYALDYSAIGTRELPISLYDLKYSYSFATAKNEKFIAVDEVNTAVPGVYKVTATATSKIAKDATTDIIGNVQVKTASLDYYVYILDNDCVIDFIADDEGNYGGVALTDNGFSVTGNLNNLYGDMYALYSKTPLTLTAEELIAHSDVQKQEISSDSISLSFSAGKLAGEEYYGYYVIANKNKTNLSTVYSFKTSVNEISTKEQFFSLARTGKLDGASANSTTIYKLVNDLDFSGFNWDVTSSTNTFSGLFNGNGHTIKNISIETSGDKNVNIFFKLKNGTITNTNFEEIRIINKNTDSGKQVGIIGEMQGGYVSRINMKNISSKGREGVSALIGQLSGNYNYISYCYLTNDENQVIAAANKYAGGIIGNAQINNDLYASGGVIYMNISNCGVQATIGDGNDAGGNTGGILGRAKNDYDVYTTIIKNCYFKGTIASQGQYGAGMVGDFDNGKGYVSIVGCYSDARFIYQKGVLDINDYTNALPDQLYAHKNMNPIIGRPVGPSTGTYDCYDNVGTWKEYYSANVKSISIIADRTSIDEETGKMSVSSVDQSLLENIGFDFKNIWNFNSDGTLTLK